MLQWIIARLNEPSTYRGVAAILTAVGIILSPEQVAAITALGLATIGILNVFRKEPPKQ